MFDVIYSTNTVKQLSKMDKHSSSIIYAWIDSNLIGCTNPRFIGKALTGDLSGYWRYRIGSYRLIAKIYDEKLVIELISVGHRRDIYQ